MEINEALVRRLVDEQFPFWHRLDLRQVLPGGWDNRTFRLGDELLVRLPSADGYAAAVAKEQRWLPVIASGVPLPVPVPVAQGKPTKEFERPWSVYRWIEGTPAATTTDIDLTVFASDLGRFLTALATVDAHRAPPAGPHTFWRGAHPRVYDADVQRCLVQLEGRIDSAAARAVWACAMVTEITAPPVWFHGDVAPGNLLMRDGRLSAVIDFGTSGVGDPRATWQSRGPCWTNQRARSSATRCHGMSRPGLEAEHGRCGRQCSPSPTPPVPTTQQERRRVLSPHLTVSSRTTRSPPQKRPARAIRRTTAAMCGSTASCTVLRRRASRPRSTRVAVPRASAAPRRSTPAVERPSVLCPDCFVEVPATAVCVSAATPSSPGPVPPATRA
ncbi:phosphotransferase [Microbacterium sp.]|uniref:phosphotransferase n=1 Tax=Microbacterium sp. TaxID=51671 RepID=UPI0035B4B7FF